MAGERFSGDPSGHGLFAVVDRDDTGVLCHECGQRFISLAPHLLSTHRINAATYRQSHGIPASESLAMPPPADGLPRRKSHPCKRCSTIITTPGKLCGACSQQRRHDLHRRRPPELHPKPPTWRQLTDEEKTELLTAIPDELAAVISRLQYDRVPSKAIAETLGYAASWMSRQHPRPGWGEKGKEQPQC